MRIRAFLLGWVSLFVLITNVAYGEDSSAPVEILRKQVGWGGKLAQTGYSVSYGGDINGDGIPDAIVGSPAGGQSGAIHIYSGQAPDYPLLFNIPGPCVHPQSNSCDTYFGSTVSQIGDLDGDGDDEFAVTYMSKGHNNRTVGIYSGGQTKADIQLWFELVEWKKVTKRGKYEYWYLTDYGKVIKPLRDVNQDGYPDFAIAASTYTLLGSSVGAKKPKPYSGEVYVYSGKWLMDERAAHLAAGNEGPVVLDEYLYGGPPPYWDENGWKKVEHAKAQLHLLRGKVHSLGQFGESIELIGDQTGDGVPELLIGAPNKGYVMMYDSATGDELCYIESEFNTVGLGSHLTGYHDEFGQALANIRDIDGDLRDDFVVSAPGTRGECPGCQHMGRLYVYSGATCEKISEIDPTLFPSPHYQATPEAHPIGSPDQGGVSISSKPYFSRSDFGRRMISMPPSDWVSLLPGDTATLNWFDPFGGEIASAEAALVVSAPELRFNPEGTAENEGALVFLRLNGTKDGQAVPWAYVFQGEAGLEDLKRYKNEYFGAHLDYLGDWNGDGTPEFIVGQPQDREPHPNTGESLKWGSAAILSIEDAQIIPLTADRNKISLNAMQWNGVEAVEFQLASGKEFAGNNYVVLASSSGVSKDGFDLGGIKVPLVYDQLTRASMFNPNSDVFEKTLSKLDGNGLANARFNLSSKSPFAEFGNRFDFVYVLYKDDGLPFYVSNVYSVEVVD